MDPIISGGDFTYEELESATDRFKNENKIGEGAFGEVFKGSLANGTEIAVKCLKLGSQHGEDSFYTEIDTYGRVHHRHVVTFMGYCISGVNRMLVYEYIANNTLSYHLHGKCHVMILSFTFYLCLLQKTKIILMSPISFVFDHRT